MATASAVEIKRANEAARQAEALAAIDARMAAIEAAQTRILELLDQPAADRPPRADRRKG